MNPNNSKDKSTLILLKPYTLKEMCVLYGVCRFTFRKWLKPFENQIGQKQGIYFSINQVKVIFDKLGYPTMYDPNINKAA